MRSWYAVKNKAYRKLKILLLIKEPIGNKLNAMGIRYFEFAKFLGTKYIVKLMAPCSAGSIDKFGFDYNPYNFKDCVFAVCEADVLIATNPHPLILFIARLFRKKIILDLYDPIIIEKLERVNFLPPKEKNFLYSIFVDWVKLQIRQSDYYICANERQRDLWVGILALLGKLNPVSYSLSKDVKGLISVIPTGVPDDPAVKSENVLRGVIPGISKTDKILLWVGAPSTWYDEKLVIYAMQDIIKVRNDIKLVFICGNPNNSEILKEDMRLSDSLGLTGKAIYFIKEWIPYNKLANYYLEADLGISLHHYHLETHFSMRNRILGYLWGGLPVIVTAGDSMAELVEQHNCGLVVREKNKEEFVAATLKLVNDNSVYQDCKVAIDRRVPAYKWRNTLSDLNKAVDFLATAKSKNGLFNLLTASCASLALASKYVYYRLRYGTVQKGIKRQKKINEY